MDRRFKTRLEARFGAQWRHTGELNALVEESITGHAIVKAFGGATVALNGSTSRPLLSRRSTSGRAASATPWPLAAAAYMIWILSNVWRRRGW